MKVLMLGWELPPHFTGGMGTVCYSLCEYLAKSGADIEFILPFEADYSDVDFMTVNPHTDESDAHISYRQLETVNATAYGKADISDEAAAEQGVTPFSEIHDRYMSRVAKVIELGEYDVVHAHDWLTMRAAIMAKKQLDVPLVVHIHATEFDRAGATEDHESGSELIHEIEYAGMMAADKIIAVSQLTKNIITKRYGISPAKVSVVHNSIDLSSPYLHDKPHAADQYAGLKRLKARGYKVVLNVGRQTIQKSLTHLLDVAHLVLERNSNVIFLFIGGGDQQHELIRRAAELKISKNVIFTGFQSGIRAQNAFKLADAFVMTSQSEPFGTTALEAIGFGTPVLVSKQSGVSEMVHSTITSDFWDTRRVADQLLGVLNYPSLSVHMTANAQREIERSTYHDTANKTYDIYQELMGVA